MWTENKNYLSRSFKFNSFEKAQEFVDCVAGLAQKLNHHPRIIWDYKKVDIELTTHDKGAVTSLDYKLADEIDILFT